MTSHSTEPNSDAGLRFGMFFSPIHRPDESPTLALQRDAEIVCRLDELGFDEAWIGEHHSTGWEYVGSPEVFIGYLAALTRRIRLGTGVVSIPYHHPYNIAERLVLLDHLSRGRLIGGFGPGALVGDARQLGIDPSQTRPRFEQGLDAILRLLGGERISVETDWFKLDRAKLQLPPFSRPQFEVAVTATFTPSGPRLAGKHGLSMLSLVATQRDAAKMLSDHWKIAEEQALLHGKTVDRKRWRLVGPVHIATTEREAREEAAFGIREWVYYMTKVTTLPLVPENVTEVDDIIDHFVNTGYAVVGTPDQAIKQIQRLTALSGGFGTFLIWANDWASREATLRSIELFSRYVIPHFQPFRTSLVESEEFARSHHAEFAPQSAAAQQKAFDDYSKSRGKGGDDTAKR